MRASLVLPLNRAECVGAVQLVTKSQIKTVDLVGDDEAAERDRIPGLAS
ncbi:MAG: hypothetical protein ACREX9_18485 [Gammaproteobacteria bacterium]